MPEVSAITGQALTKRLRDLPFDAPLSEIIDVTQAEMRDEIPFTLRLAMQSWARIAHFLEQVKKQ